MDTYEATQAKLRAPLPVSPQMTELVRFAALAPNSHNVQPWRFSIDERRCWISPDLTRRLPVVDPDDHHLFVSLGCAAENLMLAAQASGKSSAVDMRGNRIEIVFGGGDARQSPMFDAIPRRQTTRSTYDGRQVPADALRLLEEAAKLEGVSLLLLTGKPHLESVLDFVIQGNSAQMDDAAFVRELKAWIRFNPTEALATGDGLLGAASGNPSLPGWLGRAVFSTVFRKNSENRKYAEHIRSSAGVAVFVSDQESKAGWVNIGRSFQRFALQATALDLRHAHINQPVEVMALRSEFSKWLGLGGRRADLVVRFGYAPALPMSVRRPVERIIEPFA
ncbi:MAG: Tat pathway signal protein [Rhizobiales bacterium]|nr:Tat pathway signal protein [Hyphomicrobiales bacterium]